MRQLGLTWVLVDGRPAPVAAFADLAPRRRPMATCPACGCRLTLKLGRVRRHHAAHAPDARCAATGAETALHVDVKLALAAWLSAGTASSAPLQVRLRCTPRGGGTCTAVRDLAWVGGWDEVSIEAPIRSSGDVRRPDILLRRQGRPIGGIEVLVTNRVSDEKAAALARLGVPWVEMRADASLPGRLADWSSGEPLPAERIGPVAAPTGWRCGVHAVREVILRAARVVDVYRAHGRRDRLIYRVDELRLEGAVCALALRRDGRDVASVDWDGFRGSRRAAFARLHTAFDEDIALLTAAPGVFHDSPMRWAVGDAAGNLVDEALLDVAPGDPLPLATRFPHRWFFARERGAWFLPADMRDVGWNRPDSDVFAAHPAWSRGRAIVRERPAPVESWGGFLFAGRPVAEAFAAGATNDAGVAIVPVDAGTDGPPPHRALAVLASPVPDATVRRIDADLRASGVDALWLSHPLDWHPGRVDLAWAAAGRDSRGRPVVVIDTVGVYRADAFVRAFARAEPRLHPESIRARMAQRVAALRPATK